MQPELAVSRKVIDQTVSDEPFIFESVVQHVVDSTSTSILSYSVASHPDTVRMIVETEDDQSFEIIFDAPNFHIHRDEWLLVDSPHGMRRYALRRGKIIRNGIRLLGTEFFGIGVSDDFLKLILLDAHGRRNKQVNGGIPFQIKETKLEIMSLLK